MQPYFCSEDKQFTLYHGDSMETVRELSEQFDMIFADPPYFLSTGNGRVNINGQYIKFDKGGWDRVRSTSEKDEFNKCWLSACREKLKENGTIWISGTYHNIFSVARCMEELGFCILNVVCWQKPDPPMSLTDKRLNFSSEYIIWASKKSSSNHFFNKELLQAINGGTPMQDVWTLPAAGKWEKKCGKHPTQKPLRLLYRIILASTKEGDSILDPFAGSCTTGVSANLLGRRFVGIDQSVDFLELGRCRKLEITDSDIAERMLRKMSENPEDVMVVVNHARKDLKALMIEKGICYLRAGDSKGSLLVTHGFERMQYVLLHTGGDDCQLFRLKTKGSFQIWTKETLEQYGFSPEHSPYYVVLHFDGSKPIDFVHQPNLKQSINTYRAKIRPLSDFIGIK